MSGSPAPTEVYEFEQMFTNREEAKESAARCDCDICRNYLNVVGEIEMMRKKMIAVERGGNAIRIPDGVTVASVVETLQCQLEEGEAEAEFASEVDGLPWDVLLAFQNELRARYGGYRVLERSEMTMMGPRAIPPQEREVPTGPDGESIRVKFGMFRFQANGTPVDMEPRFNRVSGGRWRAQFAGMAKRSVHPELADLMAAVRRRATEESIYKGRALRIESVYDADEDEEVLDLMYKPPRFMRCEHSEDELVFADRVHASLRANLFTPIERTVQCRDLGIPLKRGVLLAGKYGTGKTLTAAVTAGKCQENGWTYLYLQDVDLLPDALELAKVLAPAVIFAEDIDQVLEGDGRDEDVNELLNTLDGVDSKSHEILLVLTTNHLERIPGVVLRPGRFDAIVEMLPPDKAAAKRLLQNYGGAALSADCDLDIVAEQLAGHIPAIIREIVERAKLYSLGEGGDGTLTTEALQGAAAGMVTHMNLIDRAAQKQPTVREQEYIVLGQAIGEALRPAQSVSPMPANNPIGRFGPRRLAD